MCFTVQLSMFIVSVFQTAHIVITFISVCQELFSFFEASFFETVFEVICRSSKRLVYPITMFFVCQQLFLLFLKHFELFIHQKQFLATAQLGYHFLPALSTPFFIFLKNIQDPRMGDVFVRLNQKTVAGYWLAI